MDKNIIDSELIMRQELEALGAKVTVSETAGTGEASNGIFTAKVTASGFHREAGFHRRDAIPAFLESCLYELKNLNLDITVKKK